MRKKVITGLTVLAFLFSTLLLMTSCAKKQVAVSGGVTPTTQEKAPAVKKAATDADKAYKDKEAARKARLREIEKAQKISDFENQKIYFDFDRSELRAEAKAILKKKAELLRQYAAYSVRIDGHCDERGTSAYNLALGERRANAAKKFLVALGVSDHLISTITYGEEKPADPGHNDEAWAKNRRDEFTLIKRW